MRETLKWLIFCLLIVNFVPATRGVAEERIFFEENFNDLVAWTPLTFSRIAKHSQFSIAEIESKRVLALKASASASAIVFSKKFNPAEYPILKWEWRVDQLGISRDPREKDGDDYPVRVFVLFEYDPNAATLWEKAKYQTAKMRFGKYPPKATLNYVWTSSEGGNLVNYPSPYTDSAQIIVKDRGSEFLGQWRHHEVDIYNDYEKAFGQSVPSSATIAVMADADDTDSQSLSYIDFLSASKR